MSMLRSCNCDIFSDSFLAFDGRFGVVMRRSLFDIERDHMVHH